MNAEIIAIGDEIASGQLLDTNTQWLGRRLEERGVRVLYHATVGDELEACAEVFRQAIARADVVLITGGLGPTADDLTRQALAEATGRRLLVDPRALAHIRALFARRRRPMPPQNELQALIPEGGRMIDNPEGTAPGIEMNVPRGDEGRLDDTSPQAGATAGLPSSAFSQHHSSTAGQASSGTPSSSCRVFALPGVPAEMRQMWHESVAARVRELTGSAGRVIRQRQIRCFGAGESQVESMLPDMIRRGREPRVGITASRATITLRITAEAADEAECLAAMEPTVATIRECLGTLIFGEGDDELQHAVVRLLAERNATLATVEWGTAGLAAQWLAEASEPDGVFLGGLVAASNAALERLLDVPTESPSRDPSADGTLVRAMAIRCRERFGATFALAVGPFPKDAPSDAGPPTFHAALAWEGGEEVAALPYSGHPAMRTAFCAKLALNGARLELLGERR